jgi:hypothetical protein
MEIEDKQRQQRLKKRQSMTNAVLSTRRVVLCCCCCGGGGGGGCCCCPVVVVVVVVVVECCRLDPIRPPTSRVSCCVSPACRHAFCRLIHQRHAGARRHRPARAAHYDSPRGRRRRRVCGCNRGRRRRRRGRRRRRRRQPSGNEPAVESERGRWRGRRSVRGCALAAAPRPLEAQCRRQHGGLPRAGHDRRERHRRSAGRVLQPVRSCARAGGINIAVQCLRRFLRRVRGACRVVHHCRRRRRCRRRPTITNNIV